LRTHEELVAEIKYRRENNLPRIELTPAEKARAFGDVSWSQTDRRMSRLNTMLDRYKSGLPLSKSDIKEVKNYLKNTCTNG
jgi:hypothetical protein